MPNRVRIIVQSDLMSFAETINEEYAEKRLEEIRKQYEYFKLSKERREADWVDNGLLVTTHLIKE